MPFVKPLSFWLNDVFFSVGRIFHFAVVRRSFNAWDMMTARRIVFCSILPWLFLVASRLRLLFGGTTTLKIIVRQRITGTRYHDCGEILAKTRWRVPASISPDGGGDAQLTSELASVHSTSAGVSRTVVTSASLRDMPSPSEPLHDLWTSIEGWQMSMWRWWRQKW